MRFCHPFTLIASSRDGKQALARHKRIGAKSSAQCDQPYLIIFSPRTIFLRQISRPTPCPKNLTEFPFGPNFSKPDWEGL
jgi:hypothetical protein